MITKWRRWAVVAVAAVSVVFAGGLLRADIIYSNMPMPSTAHLGLGVQGGNKPDSIGMQFTPGASYTMTEAQVLVASQVGFNWPNASFDLWLYSDNSGVPGSQIATVGTDLSAAAFTYPPGIVSASGLSIPLTAGDTYWLVMTPFNADSGLYWYVPPFGTVDAYSDNSANGSPPWNNLSVPMAMEIDGTPNTPVPEPGTLPLTFLGLTLVLPVAVRSGMGRCEIRRAR